MAPDKEAASRIAESASDREIEVMDHVLPNKPGEKCAVSSPERGPLISV
jgi:hypothetical protein